MWGTRAQGTSAQHWRAGAGSAHVKPAQSPHASLGLGVVPTSLSSLSYPVGQVPPKQVSMADLSGILQIPGLSSSSVAAQGLYWVINKNQLESVTRNMKRMDMWNWMVECWPREVNPAAYTYLVAQTKKYDVLAVLRGGQDRERSNSVRRIKRKSKSLSQQLRRRVKASSPSRRGWTSWRVR